MDDEQKNLPKQKLKPVSNEGKRKPLAERQPTAQKGRDDKYI